jgi:hypothetical protein
MPAQCYDLEGVRVLQCESAGSRIRTAADAVDLIAAAASLSARLIVIPVQRLGDDFFHLKTRIAGEILQKFATYHLRVVVIGDISAYLSDSVPLQDFVRECNRGSQIWFVANAVELQQRLRNCCQ